MTIEERAYQHYPIGKSGDIIESMKADAGWDGYVLGATDQKSIDDAQWRKDMQYVNIKRQELIDRVLKEFTKILLECNFEEQWAMTLTKEFKERIMEE